MIHPEFKYNKETHYSHTFEVKTVDIVNQNIIVKSDGSFKVSFPNILEKYKLPYVKSDAFVNRWHTDWMNFWQNQLNFAVWCATKGCGVDFNNHLKAAGMIGWLFQFHVYYPAFTIELTSGDAKATVFQNLGRAIIKKTIIKISGTEVMSIDSNDIYHCYVDLLKSLTGQINMAYQGIGQSNMLRHRVGAGNASMNVGDEAVANVYESRFCIPLDFELLETPKPFYQAGLGDRLEYRLTFNDYMKVTKATDAESSYQIKNFCLEFDSY